MSLPSPPGFVGTFPCNSAPSSLSPGYKKGWICPVMPPLITREQEPEESVCGAEVGSPVGRANPAVCQWGGGSSRSPTWHPLAELLGGRGGSSLEMSLVSLQDLPCSSWHQWLQKDFVFLKLFCPWNFLCGRGRREEVILTI